MLSVSRHTDIYCRKKLVSRRIKVRIGFLRYLLIIKLSFFPITQAIVKFVVGSWGSNAHFQRNSMPWGHEQVFYFLFVCWSKKVLILFLKLCVAATLVLWWNLYHIMVFQFFVIFTIFACNITDELLFDIFFPEKLENNQWWKKLRKNVSIR